jgi:hypothetical protein
VSLPDSLEAPVRVAAPVLSVLCAGLLAGCGAPSETAVKPLADVPTSSASAAVEHQRHTHLERDADVDDTGRRRGYRGGCRLRC